MPANSLLLGVSTVSACVRSPALTSDPGTKEMEGRADDGWTNIQGSCSICTHGYEPIVGLELHGTDAREGVASTSIFFPWFNAIHVLCK